MNKPNFTLKLEIGGSTENGGKYAPYKNGDGQIIIDYNKSIVIAPNEDLPSVPEGYDGWVNLPN